MANALAGKSLWRAYPSGMTNLPRRGTDSPFSRTKAAKCSVQIAKSLPCFSSNANCSDYSNRGRKPYALNTKSNATQIARDGAELSLVANYIGSLYSCAGGNPGPGNKFIQNIIVSNTHLVGSYAAYRHMNFTAPPPYPPTIGAAAQANDYYAYSGSTPLSTGQGGLTGFGDVNPQNVNPQFSGCYALAAQSPVFSAPINFPAQAANDRGIAFGQPGYWGPPGYAIAQNEAPSSLPSIPRQPVKRCGH